jgi:hypothetical protein
MPMTTPTIIIVSIIPVTDSPIEIAPRDLANRRLEAAALPASTTIEIINMQTTMEANNILELVVSFTSSWSQAKMTFILRTETVNWPKYCGSALSFPDRARSIPDAVLLGPARSQTTQRLQ